MNKSTLAYTSYLSEKISDGWNLIECTRHSFYLSAKYEKDKKTLFPDSMLFYVDVINPKNEESMGQLKFRINSSDKEMLSKVFLCLMGSKYQFDKRNTIGISYQFFKGCRCYVNIKQTSSDSGEIVDFKQSR